MNKLFFNPISVIVFIIFVFSISLSLRETAKRSQLSKQELETLEVQLDQLEESYAQTQATLVEHQSGFAQEKVLRDELLHQKSNEIIVQLPPITPPVQPTPTVIHTSPLQEWRQAIFWQ
jgi:hypothetical protein